MSAPYTRLQWVSWGGLASVIASIGVLYFFSIERSGPPLPVISQITRLNMTNQLGQVTDLGTMQGKVWVANIIFTRCAGPCAGLTRQLADVQASLDPALPVRLVSLTADPEFDTPEVLKRYGDRFQAMHDRWHFLTGAKSEIQRVAVDELKFIVVDNQENRKPDEDLFLHTTKFAVIDRGGRIRGYVDGSEPDGPRRIVKLVKRLLNEPGA